jgi:hypothetical protein
MNKTYIDTLKSIMAAHAANKEKEIESAFPSDLDAMYVRREAMLDTINLRCKDWESDKLEIEAKDYSYAFGLFVKHLNGAVCKYQAALIAFLDLHEAALTAEVKDSITVPEDILKFLEFARHILEASQIKPLIQHGIDFGKLSQADE